MYWPPDIRDTCPNTENAAPGPNMGFYVPVMHQSECRIILRDNVILQDNPANQNVG